MQRRLKNIYHLGIKELWSLARDPMMILLIIYVFSISVYTGATAVPETLHLAPIAIVDEDQSPLSMRIDSAFYPPLFTPPEQINREQMDEGLDHGRYTFVLNIPPHFQRDVLAGKQPEIQLNVDATRMSQAFSGSQYVQQIVLSEVQEYAQRHRDAQTLPVDLALRARFNPSLEQSWFGSLMQVINNVTLLAIILTGAALIREREHGTIEHLLVMPVTPAEMMISKVWSMGLVVLTAVYLSLRLVIGQWLGVPVAGSVPLFLVGAALNLFATTAMGIYLATLARSMPQFGLLLVLTVLPMQMLSGGATPRESMPELVQTIMLAAPSTHFVELGQAILYRGASLATVWPQFLALACIGSLLFVMALRRFRRTINQMA